MRQTQNAQKKDNRKSIFVIGLLLLLVAVIGFGGYTLSKYVTKKNASGKASVAKWGFTVSADATNLLGKEYKYNGANSTVNGDQGITVKAKTSEGNIVAPGTTGSMTFEIGGTAEVKAKIEVKMNVTSDIVLKYKTKTPEATLVEYYPVKWALKKTVNATTTTVAEDKTLAELKTELDKLNATVEAGAEYANAATYTIEWAWDFDANGVGTNDALDTFLGKIANDADATDDTYTKQDGTSTTFEFTLDISVTQVKE